MSKKPTKPKFDGLRKWAIGVGLSIVVVPALALSWKNIQLIWASPDKLEKVEKAVDKQMTSLEQIAKLALEEKSRNDKQEAVYQAQMDSVQKQLELIAEIKKEKR